MVANDEWIQIFLEAKVHHVSMSASDHCLLPLFLKNNQYCKRGKKHFLFKEMWTREEECGEVIELDWDQYTENSSWPIQERPGRCQCQLQCWNQNSFGNVYKTLKRKQICLQQLESLNLLHETVEEIQVVRKEIMNYTLGKKSCGTKVLKCVGCKMGTKTQSSSMLQSAKGNGRID